MRHNEVRRYWNANAEGWTRLSRAGYDVYRDHLNTPAFLDMLPDIAGLKGLDVGCGEGYNTRLLAQRGAQLAAVDIADVFVRYAQQAQAGAPSRIDYAVASAAGASRPPGRPGGGLLPNRARPQAGPDHLSSMKRST